MHLGFYKPSWRSSLPLGNFSEKANKTASQAPPIRDWHFNPINETAKSEETLLALEEAIKEPEIEIWNEIEMLSPKLR